MSNPIRVLLVDDHCVVRYGFRLMLSSANDIVIEAEAESAAEALKLVVNTQFDVALVDISLPDKNGLELLKQLRELKPRLAVLIVSAHAEDLYGVRAFKNGAAGYLNKSSAAANVVAAVRKVAAGEKYITPSLMQKLAGMLSDAAGPSYEALTDRELEVFRAIASGDSLVRIAEKLHLSPSTVTTYRSRVLEKLNKNSNAELTRYALDHDLFG